MYDYFQLVITMTNRKIRETGIHPSLGYLLSIITFGFLCAYLFFKTQYASYILMIACVSLQMGIVEKPRLEFLQYTFGDKNFKKIRLLENLILYIPFAIVLVLKGLFLEAGMLFLPSAIIAFSSFQTQTLYTIPTPFSKRPFEFTVGFRNTFLLFLGIYCLTVIAIKVGNFNLGIFTLGVIFLICANFYSKTEQDYFVWIHASNPKKLLINKMFNAIRDTMLLALPIIIALLIFSPHQMMIILGLPIFGLMAVCTFILAKYSVYPRDMNLPEGIALSSILYFPPLILFLIPFFYLKSLKKLAIYLYD
jgi:hypothetical protein